MCLCKYMYMCIYIYLFKCLWVCVYIHMLIYQCIFLWLIHSQVFFLFLFCFCFFLFSQFSIFSHFLSDRRYHNENKAFLPVLCYPSQCWCYSYLSTVIFQLQRFHKVCNFLGFIWFPFACIYAKIKLTVEIDILVTSRNGGRKIVQSIRIMSRPHLRKRKWN